MKQPTFEAWYKKLSVILACCPVSETLQHLVIPKNSGREITATKLRFSPSAYLTELCSSAVNMQLFE